MRSRFCYSPCLRPGRLCIVEPERAKKFPDILKKAGLQNSVWFHLSQWSTCLEAYERTLSFTTHSTSRPSQCLTVSNSQDHATQFARPSEKSKHGAPLLKKNHCELQDGDRRASNQARGPSEQGGPVQLHRSHTRDVYPANSFFPCRFPLS